MNLEEISRFLNEQGGAAKLGPKVADGDFETPKLSADGFQNKQPGTAELKGGNSSPEKLSADGSQSKQPSTPDAGKASKKTDTNAGKTKEDLSSPAGGIGVQPTLDSTTFNKINIPFKHKMEESEEFRNSVVTALIEYAVENEIDLDALSEEEIAEILSEMSKAGHIMADKLHSNITAGGTKPALVPKDDTPKYSKSANHDHNPGKTWPAYNIKKAPPASKKEESQEMEVLDLMIEYASENDIDLNSLSEAELEELYTSINTILSEAPYYIEDGEGNRVGNPKGYRTMRGAKQQADGRGGVRDELWNRIDTRKRNNPEDRNNTVYSIKFKESVDTTFALTDQLGSLLESEGLSEEFKTQAITVFESAVNCAAKSHIESLQEQYEVQLEESMSEYKDFINERVEKYLDYVVTEWVNENRLAVESATRNNVAESFMRKLKDLLESHYVELPAEKADLYEEEVKRSVALEEALNSVVSERLMVEAQNKELMKKLQVETFVRSLSELEAERIRELSEGLDFGENFDRKLKLLQENYFPKRPTSSDLLVEDTPVLESVEKKATGEMSRYLDVLNKMNSFN